MTRDLTFRAMHCHEFLMRYSDFRDGIVLDQAVRSKLRQHLLECPDCERHDHILRAGLQILRTEDSFSETPDLTPRIEAAIQAGLDPEWPTMPRWAWLAAAVMVGVGVALLAGSLAEKRSQTLATVPALEAVPHPRVVANPGVPFVTFEDPRAGGMRNAATDYATPPQRPFVAPVSFR